MPDSTQARLRAPLENTAFVQESVMTMPFKEAKELVLKGFERKYFENLLEKSRGNISKAARIAGMHRKNLYLKLRELKIRTKDDEDNPEEEDLMPDTETPNSDR